MPITVDEVAVDALAESLGISDSTARAALLLDEVAPGWTDHIDLSTLDMSSITKCVLGQQLGVHPYFQGCDGWDSALFRLGDAIGSRDDIDDPALYNFCHSRGDYVTLINTRRALVGA